MFAPYDENKLVLYSCTSTTELTALKLINSTEPIENKLWLESGNALAVKPKNTLDGRMMKRFVHGEVGGNHDEYEIVCGIPLVSPLRQLHCVKLY